MRFEPDRDRYYDKPQDAVIDLVQTYTDLTIHEKAVYLAQLVDVVGKTEWEEIRRRVIADYTKEKADPTQKKSVVIMGLVRPELDLRALARLLLEEARRERAEPRERP
ncbi:MAG TPA: hypothetical protein VGM94_08715 [Galbitalea sp.]|jgi:hypothetical protein